MSIALVAVAVLVVLLVLVSLRRRSRRQKVIAPQQARKAMPDILVKDVAPRPSIEHGAELDLSQRLGSSRSIFERVRSIASTGSLSTEQIDIVKRGFNFVKHVEG